MPRLWCDMVTAAGMKALALPWRLAARWMDTKANPENGELTHGGFGPYDRHHVEHGWWLLPEQWGLGIAIERIDWKPAAYDGHLVLLVHVGPFSWSIALHQPLRTAVKR